MNNNTTSTTKRGVLWIAVFLMVALAFTLVTFGSFSQSANALKMSIFVDESVLYLEDTITDEEEVALSSQNFQVYTYFESEDEIVVEDLFNHDDAVVTISDDVAVIVSSELKIVIEGIGSSQHEITAIDTETGLTATGSVSIERVSDANTVSKYSYATDDDFSLTASAHTSETRDIEGITTGTVDGESMTNITGTVAGENNFDESYTYTEDSILVKDCNSEVQNYLTVEKSETATKTVVSSTVTVSNNEAVALTDGTFDVSESNEESSSSLSSSYARVYVLDANNSDYAILTLFGNGSGSVAMTADELELIDLGGGLYSTIFGTFTIN